MLNDFHQATAIRHSKRYTKQQIGFDEENGNPYSRFHRTRKRVSNTADGVEQMKRWHAMPHLHSPILNVLTNVETKWSFAGEKVCENTVPYANHDGKKSLKRKSFNRMAIK